MSSRPQNIGIKAIEIYFPNQVCSAALLVHFLSQLQTAEALIVYPQCVEQAELEKFDGVGQGKYTIGLGQTKMSFCDDREGETLFSSHCSTRWAHLCKTSTRLLSRQCPIF
jgi:hydroxymethylglutaryl-CoA synthase